MGQQGDGSAQDIVTSLASGNVGGSSPPPGAPPLPLPSVAPVQTGGQEPPDFKKEGAEAAKGQFAAASEGGWQYDPEAMKQLIKKLESILRDKQSSMNYDANNLTGISPPGAESVSESYTGDANASGSSYQPLLNGTIDYFEGYIETLRDIDMAYQNQDQTALDEIKNTDV